MCLSTYKFLDAEDRKARLNKLMKDCDMRRDEDFNEFLSIMKTNKQKIIEYDDHSMSDFLFHAVKNLETIPYLADSDIEIFKQKCWRIKANHYIKEREKIYESASKSIKKYENQFRGKPTHREVFSVRRLFMPKDLEKLRSTFFGELVVYSSDGRSFYSTTQYYTQFVVNAPEGADIHSIFYSCLHYVQYSKPPAKEIEAVRKAEMWHEIYGKD